jgi:hypothetical protein
MICPFTQKSRFLLAYSHPSRNRKNVQNSVSEPLLRRARGVIFGENRVSTLPRDALVWRPSAA